MIDVNLAKTIKLLNKKVPLVKISFLDENYKPAKDYSIVLLEFKNEQRFELNDKTFDAHFKGFPFFKQRAGT